MGEEEDLRIAAVLAVAEAFPGKTVRVESQERIAAVSEQVRAILLVIGPHLRDALVTDSVQLWMLGAEPADLVRVQETFDIQVTPESLLVELAEELAAREVEV